MEYLLEGKKYHLSYSELREKFIEFMNNLPEIIHFAFIVCFLKEIPSYLCLSDIGIIHELSHLLYIPEENTTTLEEIRKIFNDTLSL